MTLLEADLRESDITRNRQDACRVDRQAVAELQKVLVVYSHLKAAVLGQNHEVKVSVGHEGEVVDLTLLAAPLTSLAVVAHHHVAAVAKVKTHIKVQGHVSGTIVTLQVDGEP